MKWIKFSDKHPEEGVDVLVTDGEEIGAGNISYYDDKKQFFHIHGAAFGGYEWEWNWGSDMNVTHWMPLPKLPSSDESLPIADVGGLLPELVHSKVVAEIEREYGKFSELKEERKDNFYLMLGIIDNALKK